MKIFLNKNESSSCDYHRIILPYKYLTDTIFVDDYTNCDLYIFNRFPHMYDDWFFKEQKKYGFKYIIDLDDYWILDKTHYLSKAFIDNKVFERTVNFIKKADFITVTNKQLYFLCRKYNKNVEIVKNALPFGFEQFNSEKTESENIRFGYCGGLSHVHDLNILNNSNIANTDIDFTLLGYDKTREQSEKMFNEIIFKNKKAESFKPLDSYMDLYNGIDVSLVPLQRNFFNICKSNLKILEAGCKGIPVIASKVLPYYNDLDKPKVLFANNVNEWVEQINKLKNNRNLVIDLGLDLKEHVEKNYDLIKENEKRRDIINKLS